MWGRGSRAGALYKQKFGRQTVLSCVRCCALWHRLRVRDFGWCGDWGVVIVECVVSASMCRMQQRNRIRPIIIFLLKSNSSVRVPGAARRLTSAARCSGVSSSSELSAALALSRSKTARSKPHRWASSSRRRRLPSEPRARHRMKHDAI